MIERLQANVTSSTVLGLYLIWLFFTRHAKQRVGQWGHRWMADCFLRNFLGCIARLSGVRSGLHFPLAEKPDQLRKAIPCVVTVSPHGAFGVGFFICHFHRLLNDPRFQPFQVFAGGASILFYVPLLRELLLLIGVREAREGNLDNLLSSGRSVALVPGGIWEQIHTSHEEESIHLQDHLGFIRLAMRHGVPIMPCYGFGENQLYRAAWYAESTLPLRRWIAERLRIGLPAVVGRLGIFPFPRLHLFVVGQLVQTSAPNPNPTDKEVMEVLERWKAEMQRMFNEHKHILPPEVAARGLTISVRHRSRL